MTGNNEYLLKICVLGTPDPLKIRFVHSFAEVKFDTNYLPTQGADISTKRIHVDTIPVKLILTVVAGKEWFESVLRDNPNAQDIRPSYCRGASGAIIIFDKSDLRSFEEVPDWLEGFQKYIHPAPIALVGLITDSTGSSQEISSEEGQALATRLSVVYFESEPTDLQQASEIFSYLAKQVIKRK